MKKMNVNTKATQKVGQDEIIRIQKKQSNFVMLDKTFIEDERLSWKAKGILTYLLSKPDQWKVIVKDIVKHGLGGQRAVYSALNELKKYGYYKKYPVRNEQRIVRWESVVYECPQDYQEETKQIEKIKKTEKNSLKPMEESKDSLLCVFEEVENEEIQNSDRNNINHNNNNISKELSISQSKSESESSFNQPPQEKIFDTIDIHTNNISEYVANNISLEELKVERPGQQQEVQDLYQIICDILTVPDNESNIRVSKQYIPLAKVKQELVKIKKDHISYILDCLKKSGNNIKSNKKAYYLTSLFHSTRTIQYYSSPMPTQTQSDTPYSDFLEKNIKQSINNIKSLDVDAFFEKAIKKSMKI